MAVEERKSFLVVTLSNIGDVVLTTPVISAIRAGFPNSRITVIVGPKAAGILQGSRAIERLLIYDKYAPLSRKLEMVRALRENFYDYAVDLRNSALPFMVRADRRSPLFRKFKTRSARENHLEILQRTVQKKSGSAFLPVFDFFSKEDEESLERKLNAQECMVIAPGAGSEMKRWPVEKFSEALERLLELTDLSAVIVGSAQEKSLGETLARVNSRRVQDLTGRITLRELAAVTARARLVLTNDSAPMHLGHELQRPVVALFGPTDPERYGRKGPFWKIIHSASLQALSVEAVVEACQTVLELKV